MHSNRLFIRAFSLFIKRDNNFLNLPLAVVVTKPLTRKSSVSPNSLKPLLEESFELQGKAEFTALLVSHKRYKPGVETD